MGWGSLLFLGLAPRPDVLTPPVLVFGEHLGLRVFVERPLAPAPRFAFAGELQLVGASQGEHDPLHSFLRRFWRAPLPNHEQNIQPVVAIVNVFCNHGLYFCLTG